MAPATGYVPIEANAEEEERADTRRASGIAKRTLVKDYDPEEPRRPQYSAGGGEWTKDGGSGSVGDFFSRHLQDLRRRLANLVPPQLRTYHVIGAGEIPAVHPKHPVQFLDNSGRPILDDQGKPMLRPDDLPPEKYAQAGAASHLAGHIKAWKSQMDEPMTRNESVMAGLVANIAQELGRHFSMAALSMLNGSTTATFAIIATIRVSRPASLWRRRTSAGRISLQ
jgi:hypothetical protein